MFLVLALAGAVAAAPPALANKDHDGESDYDRAQQLHGDGHYDEAAGLWIASYKAGFREETAAYNAACALARGGHKDLAFQWLDRAYEDGFDLEQYLDDDDDLRSLRGDPRFAALSAKVNGGQPSRKAREGQRLAQKLDTLRARKETDPDKYDELGRELLDAGRYEEAARAFEAEAARDDEPATALYNGACARAQQGQKGPALDLLQRAVEQGYSNPKHMDEDDDLDNIRNEARFKQIRALAVELDLPDHSEPRQARDAQRFQAALPRIEGAARNHPQLGQAWFNLGFAYIALGRGADAVAPFQRAIDLGYRKGASTYNLACAHAMAGHKDEAFAALDRALAAGFHQWWQIRQDADLDEIRYDPRFRKVLEQARAHEKDSWH